MRELIAPPVGWLSLPDAELYYEPAWLADHEGLCADLATELIWRQDRIRLFGREHPVPRLTAWFADPGVRYKYSGLNRGAALWPRVLDNIRRRLNRQLDAAFNSVLVNYYRDGNDCMGLHSDNERELGENPLVATVSLGATRRFVLRRKPAGSRDRVEERLAKNRCATWRADLAGGSLLVMAGACQARWRHEIPRTARTAGARISLTFRHIRNCGLSNGS